MSELDEDEWIVLALPRRGIPAGMDLDYARVSTSNIAGAFANLSLGGKWASWALRVGRVELSFGGDNLNKLRLRPRADGFRVMARGLNKSSALIAFRAAPHWHLEERSRIPAKVEMRDDCLVFVFPEDIARKRVVMTRPSAPIQPSVPIQPSMMGGGRR